MMKPSDYQQAREQLLHEIDRLRGIRDELVARDPLFIHALPVDVRQKMLLLDRESTRLRNPDLTIAFVGGFSAGKSSLVNAFLGRYLLPESTKVTTAVPTFVRSTTGDECAELHYLNEAEVEHLGELYRKEIAHVFGQPELASLPFASLMEAVKPLAQEGRGRRLVDQFVIYHEQRHRRDVEARGRVVTVPVSKAQEIIRDETEAMFLDRVLLRIAGTDLPQDVLVVDLPGVSVPNPRHREITFRFVRDEAHAVVFVLMATRLFDKDETEIMELFRRGENCISEKTFWAVNRWDSLSSQQQRQTVADFENKMQEFGIPPDFRSFRTNALHGLLSQLGLQGETAADPALQSHIKDYEEALSSRYGDSHQTAFHESQIPQLQEQVLSFLNTQLRQTTLQSAFENAKTGFCEPMPHHLRRAKETDDSLLTGRLKREEKEEAHVRVQERFDQRKDEIHRRIKGLRNEVAVKRSDILLERTEQLVEELRLKIENGAETDAFQIYQEIIAGRELRKYPYHFEIEMRIVDNLNTMLKQNFRSIVRGQVESVFDDLTKNVQAALEKVREDVGYSTEVMSPFDEIIREESHSFGDRVDGVVMTLAAQLDELLLFKPKGFFGFRKGNEVLEGLEQAARLGFENLKNPGQSIREEDFLEKTRRIRQTLIEHYINRVREYHEGITHDVFPIVINNMQQIEKRILDVMHSKYRPSLEIMFSKEVGDEFAARHKDVEERSRRFRETIEEIEEVCRRMGTIVSAGPGRSAKSKEAALA